MSDDLTNKVFCYVENGTILQGPMNLPKRWKNVSNFDLITDIEELKSFGWVLYESSIEGVAPEDLLEGGDFTTAYRYLSSSFDITSDKVTENRFYYKLSNIEIQEIEQTYFDGRWDAIRGIRARKLQETDFWCIFDYWDKLTEEEKNVRLAYRQALRDIPQTYTNPEDVVWPVNPDSNLTSE